MPPRKSRVGNLAAPAGGLSRVSGFLDRVVEAVAPARAAKRAAARAAMAAFSRGGVAHHAARSDRLKGNWAVTSGSPDEDNLPELEIVRERSRDLNRNDGHAAGVTGAIVDNVIGTGIRPQSRADASLLEVSDDATAAWAKTAERAWRRWSPWADAADRMSLEEIQGLAERQVLENGEVFILPVRVAGPGRPYSLALDVVEADRVKTPNEHIGNDRVRDGIEVGDRGEPVAYWVRKDHPGDLTVGRWNMSNSASNYWRIPARNSFGQRNVYHVYWLRRPGQTRGFPFFGPVIRLFKDLGDYFEAEIVAARIAACFALFINKNDPAGAVIGATERTQEGKRIGEIQPGLIEYLGMGESVSQVNPARPGSNFDAFVTRCLKAISAGCGLPYEVVARDYSQTNYSSARAALLEARRMFAARQTLHVVRWLHLTWQLLIEEAYLAGDFGALAAPGVTDRWEDWTRATWIPQGWSWVDPEKEARAAGLAMQNGLSTLADEAAAQGRDWEEVLAQQAREAARRQDLGLPPAPTSAPAPTAPAPAPEVPDDPVVKRGVGASAGGA